jgi:hypothetical protein
MNHYRLRAPVFALRRSAACVTNTQRSGASVASAWSTSTSRAIITGKQRRLSVQINLDRFAPMLTISPQPLSVL